MLIELNFPNAVARASDFFNREAALAEIKHTLRSLGPRPVVIIGERVIGKTSLLKVVIEWLEEEPQVSVLDLPHAYSRDGLAAEMIQGLCFEVGCNLAQTGLLDERGQFNLVTVGQFVNAIRQLVAVKPNLHFVLCLDEFDSMLKKCDDATANQILDFVLYLIERDDLPLRFLFTMTQITERILHAYASPFLNSARLIRLAPWPFERSREFVNWLLKDRFVFDEDVQRQLFAIAGGHPYLTKAILQSLLDQHQDRPTGFRITPELVPAAVNASIRSPEVDFTLSNIVKAHFTDAEVQLLEEISAGSGLLHEERLKHLGASYLEAAQRLAAGGYLSLDEHRNYCLRPALLGRWLQQRSFGVQRLPVAAGPLPPAADPAPPPAITGSKLLIDDSQRRVYLAGEEIRLSRLEYRLLQCLGQQAGQLVSKEVLARQVWPDEEYQQGFGDERIDAAISRLRKKLGDNANTPTYLETRIGRGYILHRATYIPASKR